MFKNVSAEFLIVTQGGAERSYWVKQDGCERKVTHGGWFPRDCGLPTSHVYVMIEADGMPLHSQILSGDDWEHMARNVRLRGRFYDLILTGSEPKQALALLANKHSTYVRAVIWFVNNVEPSDDPRCYHAGPEYDLYEITVEFGPQRAFLAWFEQENGFDLCRVGETPQFLDLGSPKKPINGEVFEFTFEEFFPLWLDSAVRVAQADIHRMARDALSKLTND